jgi:hypothetical protein
MKQHGGTEAEILASADAPLERELVVAIDTGAFWIGNGVDVPADLPKQGPVAVDAFTRLASLPDGTNLPTVDESSAQLPDVVRAVLAQNLADPTTPEGVAAAAIIGRPGAKGDAGAQGLPGVNAIENDAAVAGYVSTTGSSATRAALDALYPPKTGTQVMQVLDNPKYAWAVVRSGRAALLVRHDGRTEMPRGVQVFDGDDSTSVTAMLQGNGLSFALVKSNRISELAIDLSGRFPKWVAEALVTRGKGVLPTAAPVGIAGWGDSITHADGSPAPYMKIVADYFGRPSFNGGWSGQSVEHIAARQGGVPAVMTFPSNTIPASGSATVTMDVNPCYPLNSRTTVTVRGRVQGIAGALSWDGSTFTFTRDTAGQFPVVLAGGAKFVPEDGSKYRAYDALFWAGRNGTANVDKIVSMTRAMVDYHQLVNPRYLVLQVLPGADTTAWPDPAALNWALSQEFPENFVRVGDWLKTDAAAAAVGYTLTSDDRADVAAGFTPRGYRTAGSGYDAVHINSLGRSAVAVAIENEYTARGWN